LDLEQRVIASWRKAIEHLGIDDSVVREERNDAHHLFARHLMEWSEDFATLYRQMYEIYCAHTPKEKGHYHVSHVGIGYSSFPIHKWVADKEQPPRPTARELVTRFDRLIAEYMERRKAA